MGNKLEKYFVAIIFWICYEEKKWGVGVYRLRDFVMPFFTENIYEL